MRKRMMVAVLGAAVTVRVVKSRRRRSLHPAGRSFAAEVELHGSGWAGDGEPLGATLLDEPGRFRATVRLSKGVGTRGSRPDVRGLAVRVHLPGRDVDLLFSTAGRGRVTRHLPVPRRSFDADYGTITAYRTATRDKVYLAARPDPDGPEVGSRLGEVEAGDRFVLDVRHGTGGRRVGRVRLRAVLSPAADAALAFDPIRNSLPDLHPTGLVHGVRAFAYRASQRWRGAEPASPNPAAITRAGAPN